MRIRQLFAVLVLSALFAPAMAVAEHMQFRVTSSSMSSDQIRDYLYELYDRAENRIDRPEDSIFYVWPQSHSDREMEIIASEEHIQKLMRLTGGRLNWRRLETGTSETLTQKMSDERRKTGLQMQSKLMAAIRLLLERDLVSKEEDAAMTALLEQMSDQFHPDFEEYRHLVTYLDYFSVEKVREAVEHDGKYLSALELLNGHSENPNSATGDHDQAAFRSALASLYMQVLDNVARNGTDYPEWKKEVISGMLLAALKRVELVAPGSEEELQSNLYASQFFSETFRYFKGAVDYFSSANGIEYLKLLSTARSAHPRIRVMAQTLLDRLDEPVSLEFGHSYIDLEDEKRPGYEMDGDWKTAVKDLATRLGLHRELVLDSCSKMLEGAKRTIH